MKRTCWRPPAAHPGIRASSSGPNLRYGQNTSGRLELADIDAGADLAMFNLAIDSKLRGCDVVALKVEDVAPNGYAIDRATIRQRKTGRPVKFELTEQTRGLSLNGLPESDLNLGFSVPIPSGERRRR